MSQEGNEEPREPEKKVNEEWKASVRREKEQARERRQNQQGDQGAPNYPEPDFQVFMAGLYTQTLMALGELEHPASGEKTENLQEASYLIDTIDMLAEKTEGNLSEEEKRYLDNLQYDLKMRYIQESKKDEDQSAQNDR